MLFECGVNFIVVECVAFYALQPKYEEKNLVSTLTLTSLHALLDGWTGWMIICKNNIYLYVPV